MNDSQFVFNRDRVLSGAPFQALFLKAKLNRLALFSFVLVMGVVVVAIGAAVGKGTRRTDLGFAAAGMLPLLWPLLRGFCFGGPNECRNCFN